MADVSASGTAGASVTGSGSASRTRGASGTSAARMSAGRPVAVRYWPHTLGLPETGVRRLDWDVERLALVVVDGDVHAEMTASSAEMPAGTTVRERLEVIDEMPHHPPTPLDEVELEWPDQDGVRWTVQRRPSGGSWADIATPAESRLRDGPLEDDTYDYRVVAEDEEGDTATSDTETVTVSSAPEPPADLSASVSGGTLELTWTASDSGDVDHYAVYRAVDADIDPDAVPHATPGSSPWSEDVSGVSGRLLYLVRAVDADGHEEGNIEQMVAVDVDAGSELQRPNSPDILEGRPASGGEVEVVAGYSRSGEDGEATKVNLYVNDGAGGAIDWNTAEDTVDLPGFGVAQVTLTSSGLTAGDTYRCGVRAETDAGVEDTNTDYVEATADDDAPSSPDLSAEVV